MCLALPRRDAYRITGGERGGGSSFSTGQNSLPGWQETGRAGRIPVVVEQRTEGGGPGCGGASGRGRDRARGGGPPPGTRGGGGGSPRAAAPARSDAADAAA